MQLTKTTSSNVSSDKNWRPTVSEIFTAQSSSLCNKQRIHKSLTQLQVY